MYQGVSIKNILTSPPKACFLQSPCILNFLKYFHWKETFTGKKLCWTESTCWNGKSTSSGLNWTGLSLHTIYIVLRPASICSLHELSS